MSISLIHKTNCSALSDVVSESGADFSPSLLPEGRKLSPVTDLTRSVSVPVGTQQAREKAIEFAKNIVFHNSSQEKRVTALDLLKSRSVEKIEFKDSKVNETAKIAVYGFETEKARDLFLKVVGKQLKPTEGILIQKGSPSFYPKNLFSAGFYARESESFKEIRQLVEGFHLNSTHELKDCK